VAGEPLYSVVASRAHEHITSGEWREGDRLPPERRLCQDFGVSRATLRQALSELEDRGLITRHQGRGTFVARPRSQLPIIGVFSIRDAMEARGLEMTTRVLGVEVVEASRQLAAELVCLPGDPIVAIERLRIGDGEPLVLDTAHLRAELFPGLEAIDFEQRSLYHALETDYGRTIAAAQETLEPVILTAHECRLLGVPAHTTALLTRRITTDDAGVVLVLGHVLLRGDRSRYLYKRVVEPASMTGARHDAYGTIRRPASTAPLREPGGNGP
jgi:DNA-binding GntR family transcriptional regulator